MTDSTPDFGPNVLVFDDSMPSAAIQEQVDHVFRQQEKNQFGANRFALLFKPGTYDNSVKVGYYTQVAGLGHSPDEVTIRGTVESNAAWHQGNALVNFWRAAENMAVVPAGGTQKWAVSQAAPFRRMHVRGNLVLYDKGWSSGGFMSDTKVDGAIDSGTQQQWITRNSDIGGWKGSNWNMVFAGVTGAPSAASWPDPPYTVIGRSPVVREKPFLTIDADGRYSVFVPALSRDSSGISWGSGRSAGTSIPLDRFYIAKAGDTAAAINAALDQGRHILFTPGIYRLNDTLRITHPDTVVLGLGLATLMPENGIVAMSVADVDGVKIAGLLFDAGAADSPTLLEVGPRGSSASHAANPTSLHDLFFRIGGAAVGKADVSLRINSNDVIGDHFWLWRADHGDGVGWTLNTADTGLIVDGDNVTIYGLFVEHYQKYQTVWSGNGGKVYFYQSEIPYDPPAQAKWMNGQTNGFASYKVADSATGHQAWGLGVYCFFRSNPDVKLESAIEAPDSAIMHHMTTVSLGGGIGEITHVINHEGASVHAGSTVARLAAAGNPVSSIHPIPAMIKFWNGNKTKARQVYEREVLEAALDATAATDGAWQLASDTTDFPSAAEEGSVFRAKGFDIFGTVMGNAKLANEKKIIVPQPIMKGLLGYRILIIREEDREKFASISSPEQLQKLRLGIPETWADAELFRRNGYTVVEKGSFDDLFTRLRNHEFDYVSFGANEVDSVFAERAAKGGGLAIDSSLLVYYPFPVVFYVNSDNPALAERVTRGLNIIGGNGALDRIFERHYGALLAKFDLPQRRLISLKNHLLPKEMSDLKPVLIEK